MGTTITGEFVAFEGMQTLILMHVPAGGSKPTWMVPVGDVDLVRADTVMREQAEVMQSLCNEGQLRNGRVLFVIGDPDDVREYFEEGNDINQVPDSFHVGARMDFFGDPREMLVELLAAHQS